MHRIVLALMIVLLPLRGWAADVMSVDMASHSVAMKSGAADAHKMAATASANSQKPAAPDCHGAILGEAQNNNFVSNDKATGDEHSGSCQACQACHTQALSPPPAAVSSVLMSPQLHPAHAFEFTSAAAALSQKPPIS